MSDEKGHNNWPLTSFVFLHGVIHHSNVYFFSPSPDTLCSTTHDTWATTYDDSSASRLCRHQQPAAVIWKQPVVKWRHSTVKSKPYRIPKLKCFSSRLTAVFAQSRCIVKNEDVVWAAPTGDAPTASEWSTILLPTQVRIIFDVLRYLGGVRITLQLVVKQEDHQFMCAKRKHIYHVNMHICTCIYGSTY